MRRVLVAGILFVGAVIALLGPWIRPRHESAYAATEVVLPVSGVPAVIPWVMTVRVRNTKGAGEHRRLWIRGVDVSESLLGNGAVLKSTDGVEAAAVPFARARRLPLRVEVPAGQQVDLSFQVRGTPPGRSQGTVDVLFDATTWIRTEVSWDVAVQEK